MASNFTLQVMLSSFFVSTCCQLHFVFAGILEVIYIVVAALDTLLPSKLTASPLSPLALFFSAVVLEQSGSHNSSVFIEHGLLQQPLFK
jgi:hypothetical protein